jgi:alanyl-tRNA synthetase
LAAAKVFWDDPYLTELEAVVTGSENDTLTVDRTIFFAFSGGQEADTGTINDRRVLRAEKTGLEIFYTLEPGLSPLRRGEKVLMRIDWPRRYRLMRLHFAAELVLELVNQNFHHPEKIGAHISEQKARLDFAWEGSIGRIFPFLEEELSRIIVGDSEIMSCYADMEDELRYWKIAGFGQVSCGGTHPKRTGEVGRIKLKRDNIGKGKERIEITLENPQLNLGI